MANIRSHAGVAASTLVSAAEFLSDSARFAKLRVAVGEAGAIDLWLHALEEVARLLAKLRFRVRHW